MNLFILIRIKLITLSLVQALISENRLIILLTFEPIKLLVLKEHFI